MDEYMDEYNERVASHAALDAAGELVSFPIVASPAGHVFAWPLAGGDVIIVPEDALPRGYAQALSSCPHTRSYSYVVCRKCAAEWTDQPS